METLAEELLYELITLLLPATARDLIRHLQQSCIFRSAYHLHPIFGRVILSRNSSVLVSESRVRSLST